jgi:hypothetical protein
MEAAMNLWFALVGPMGNGDGTHTTHVGPVELGFMVLAFLVFAFVVFRRLRSQR